MIENKIYGKNPALETLRKKEVQINKIYIQDGIHGKEYKMILDLIKKHGFSYQIVPKKKLDLITDGNNHQGIVIDIPPYKYHELDDIIKDKKERSIILLLDQLEDPHNLGSIIRSSDVFNVDGIVIPKRRSVTLNSTVAKVSTGAIEHVKVSQVTNLKNAIEKLKKEGYWIVGTDASAPIEVKEIDKDLNLAIIIGSEGKGISDSLTKHVDYMVKIPMFGHVNSLNASVSTGIILYEVRR